MPKRKVVRSDSESESQGSGSESDEFESVSEESDEPLQKKPKLSKVRPLPLLHVTAYSYFSLDARKARTIL